ncbi:integron integrase [Microbulbifer pacificus]|uniref:Integron integrase n=1 Tax=Microbulbifer pacificus TaxID=407164 RepID=A0AAU0MX01_9GAMM|nr:integron integrase [Microbulbifer pacificus]WOX05048.1 integron integrase [Microbulbifer pacificus]
MEYLPRPIPTPPVRFMDRLRAFMRAKRLAYRTEDSYCHWIRDFIRFHGMQRPEHLGAKQIDQWLSHLVCDRSVSVNTQKIALNAVVFLYRQFLRLDIEPLQFSRAKKGRKLPEVFSHEEATQVLSLMSGPASLAASLMYGSGLRVMEAARLRVRDLDFDRCSLIVRESKGEKWRNTLLPESLLASLKAQVEMATALYRRDLEEGFGTIYVPGRPSVSHREAGIEWLYVFPAQNRALCPITQVVRRHHMREQQIRRAVRRAIKQAGIAKMASCHTFRHSFATNLLVAGTSIRDIQELLGHSDVSTTMIYTHVVGKHKEGTISPLDYLR